MIVVVVAEWLIGTIIFFINGKKDYAKWISYTAFCAGMGGFSVIIDETMRPYLKGQVVDSLMLDNLLSLSAHLFSFIAQNVAPYTYVMFGICYSGFFSNATKRTLSYILFVPIVIMFIISPIHPNFDLPHALLTSWVAPYILFTNILLVFAIIKAKNPIAKRSFFFTAVITIPPTLFSLVTNYFLRSFGMEDSWRLNPWAIALQIILFAIFAIKYEVLGVKLKFEEGLDNTIRAMTSGTSILNHTIKNEILKIEYLTDKVQDYIAENKDEEAGRTIAQIKAASKHMLNMTNKIKERSEEILLDAKIYSTYKITDKVIELIRPLAEKKKVQIFVERQSDVELMCDFVHVKETLVNICLNAIEAMEPNQGILRIKLFQLKKFLFIEIEDNGVGIPEHNLPFVFEPFFSTKRTTNNYGLGLSYCYRVMKKHHGDMTIESKVGTGTTVTLRFRMRGSIALTNESGE